MVLQKTATCGSPGGWLEGQSHTGGDRGVGREPTPTGPSYGLPALLRRIGVTSHGPGGSHSPSGWPLLLCRPLRTVFCHQQTNGVTLTSSLKEYWADSRAGMAGDLAECWAAESAPQYMTLLVGSWERDHFRGLSSSPAPTSVG